jgi:hypothetical protein
VELLYSNPELLEAIVYYTRFRFYLESSVVSSLQVFEISN